MFLCVSRTVLHYIWRNSIALWKCLTTLLSHRTHSHEQICLINENDPIQEHKIDVAFDSTNDRNPPVISLSNSLSEKIPKTFHCDCHQPSDAQIRDFNQKWSLLSSRERNEAMMVSRVGISSAVSLVSTCAECQMHVDERLNSVFCKKETKMEQYGIKVINEDVFSLSDVVLVNPLDTLCLFLHYESYGKNMRKNLFAANRSQTVPKKNTRCRCTIHSGRPDAKRPIPTKFRIQWLHLTSQQQKQVTCIPTSKLCKDLEAHIDRFGLSEASRRHIFAAYKELVACRLARKSTAFATSILLLEPVPSQSQHVRLSICFDTLLQLVTFANQNWTRRNVTISTTTQARDEVLNCLGVRLWLQIQTLWKSLKNGFHERLTVYCIVVSIRRKFEDSVERYHGHELMAQLLEEEDRDVQRLAQVRARRSDRKKRKRHYEKAKKQRKTVEVNAIHQTSHHHQYESVRQSPHEKKLTDSNLELKNRRIDSDTVPETFVDIVDDAEELRLLCSMGWKAPNVKLRSLGKESHQYDAIPEQELTLWRQNMENMKFDRIAERQLVQERFQRLMMRKAVRG